MQRRRSLFGSPGEEFGALTIPAIHPFESKEILADGVPNLRVSFRAGPWRHRKKDGTVFDVGSSSHEVVFKGRPARVVMIEDLSDRAPLERELRDASRQAALWLEAVGEGVCGVENA